MDNLNALDWIIIIILVTGFVNGFRKGLIMSLATLLGVFLGIWLAMKGSVEMEELIRGNTSIDGPAIPYISFIAVFAVVYIVCYLGGKALSSAIKLLMLGIFDKIAGGFFGALKAMLFASLAFLMINYFGWSAGSEKTESQSALHNFVKDSSSKLYPAIKSVFPDKRPDFLDKIFDS
jgi:membrane protein required for colicin V production